MGSEQGILPGCGSVGSEAEEESKVKAEAPEASRAMRRSTESGYVGGGWM